MSFGIGAFPFGFFATNLNLGNHGNGGPNGGPRPAPGATSAAPGSAQYEEEVFLSRVFLWVALAFMLWLFIA